jgi:ketosteroid isomerase-like protein
VFLYEQDALAAVGRAEEREQTMSQENVEIYRNAVEAGNRGDWDAWPAGMDPHILVRADPIWPEQRIYGREAVIAVLREGKELWGNQSKIEGIVDLGDRLLVRQRWTIRASRSGVEGELRVSMIATFREGRVILVEYFLEHERALEALEMRE